MSPLTCDWCGDLAPRAALVPVGDALVCPECDRLSEHDPLDDVPAAPRSPHAIRSEDGERLGGTDEHRGGYGRE